MRQPFSTTLYRLFTFAGTTFLLEVLFTRASCVQEEEELVLSAFLELLATRASGVADEEELVLSEVLDLTLELRTHLLVFSSSESKSNFFGDGKKFILEKDLCAFSHINKFKERAMMYLCISPHTF